MGAQAGAILGLLKDTFKEWQEDRAERLAAALAYYTIFSLAPILLIAIAVAGLVFGEEAARGQIVGQISGMVGQEGGEAIEAAIQSAWQPSASILATIIGLGALFLGASGLFGQLQDALNTIWGVKPKPGRGIVATIRERFLSFTMVLGIGFLLLTSLVLSAGLAALTAYFEGMLPGADVLWQALNFVVSFGVIMLMFAMIFKILPDATIAWRDVWLGAALTALLFTIGKLLIGLYLGNASVGSTYGAAGSLLVILLWIYYSAQILFFGAEFTQVYANTYGSHIVPESDAVALTEEARARQGIPRQPPVERAARTGESVAEAARAMGPAEGKRATRAVGRAGSVAEPPRSAPSDRASGGRLNAVRLGTLLVGVALALIGFASRRDEAPAAPERPLADDTAR